MKRNQDWEGHHHNWGLNLGQSIREDNEELYKIKIVYIDKLNGTTNSYLKAWSLKAEVTLNVTVEMLIEQFLRPVGIISGIMCIVGAEVCTVGLSTRRLAFKKKPNGWASEIILNIWYHL